MNNHISLIHGLIRRLYDAAKQLPVIRLSPAERSILSGAIGADGPVLVTLTAKAICQHPAQFTHVGDMGPGLILRQRYATALHKLREALDDMRQIIGDTYLVAQAEAVLDARRLLRQTDDEALLPLGPPAGHEDRRVALLSPLLFLQERRERLRGRLKGLLQRGTPRPVRSDVRSRTAEQLLRRLRDSPGAWGLCPGPPVALLSSYPAIEPAERPTNHDSAPTEKSNAAPGGRSRAPPPSQTIIPTRENRPDSHCAILIRFFIMK